MKNYKILVALILFTFLSSVNINAQCIPSSVTVYTPRGSGINALQYSCEPLSSKQILDNTTWVKVNYPSATIIAPSTGKYNCHSYAWYSTNTNNNIWINSPGDDAYWMDGSFTYPMSEITASKWSYFNGDHSARTFPLGQNSTVRSKWGQLPLMYHVKEISPYKNTTGYIAFEDCTYSSNTCKAPGVLWSTNITKNSVTLNWTRACNASQYQIQYKLLNGSTWFTIKTWSPPNPHFALAVNVSGMASNICYNFRVKVLNGTGIAYSTIETVCTNQSFRQLENVSDKFERMPSLSLGEVEITEVTGVKNTNSFSSYTCLSTIIGLNINISNVSPNSYFVLTNNIGQTICQGKEKGSEINCTVPSSGIYIISIFYNDGNKWIQKVFVK
jgi:hypothetical protein